MAEKRYYWLKLQEDFFSSKRIKKLRKIAGGDTYTIIYLKMQLLSIRSGGVLKYTGLESSFAEELALDIDEDVENVAVTLQFLLSCGLIETSDNIEYLLPFAVLNTGSEGSSAKRVREYRERHKALPSNNGVTQVKQICYGEKEIEIDKDKDIDIDPPISPHKKTEQKTLPVQNPFSGELHEAFDDWLAYKKEKHQPYKPRGLQSLISQITKYSERYGDSETANAIRNSMASNYQGIVFDRIGKNGSARADINPNGRNTAKKSEDYKGEDFFDT